ncbi:ATP-binding protein [Aureimonas altamirensis]|uniref:ATP-binding protein n=1 Tax=Aureimonas altamirensis TaxID=370622 RepID=UPI002036BF39|nr:ATP-binding protein [Aureimonas altamirensis]MCM2503855.1 ATP-binding protein [Aureimonas altamirensis]
MRPQSSATEVANRSNLLLLIQLRWIAVAGQVFTILFVHFRLGIGLPMQEMCSVLALLAAVNIASFLRYQRSPAVSNRELFAQLLLDVTALSAQLYLSGGALNPFISLFLLQVIIGAVLLAGSYAWALVVVATGCFVALSIVYRPIDIPHEGELAIASLHVQGLFICFLLVAVLLTYLIIRINGNLAARDARVAELRRQAVEEDHIVRIGLLASGAAHELGTPLATLSVIMNDWRRADGFRSDPGIIEELEEAEAQLDRCKTIVSSILTSAGQTRGEGTVRTTVRAFFDDLIADWSRIGAARRLTYFNDFAPDQPMVVDLALRQVVFNLLDNALEASRRTITVTLSRDGDHVLTTVSDDGPGFSPEVLESLGRPYVSTKGRPGAGLGLFLVSNVVRKLGGTLEARNAGDGGGTTVVLRLPLSSIGKGQ